MAVRNSVWETARQLFVDGGMQPAAILRKLGSVAPSRAQLYRKMKKENWQRQRRKAYKQEAGKMRQNETVSFFSQTVSSLNLLDKIENSLLRKLTKQGILDVDGNTRELLAIQKSRNELLRDLVAYQRRDPKEQVARIQNTIETIIFNFIPQEKQAEATEIALEMLEELVE